MNNVNNIKTSTSNISKVSINIVFDSLLINNDRSIFGDGKWNFSIFAKNKTLDLLTNSKVKNNQLINLNEKKHFINNANFRKSSFERITNN